MGAIITTPPDSAVTQRLKLMLLSLVVIVQAGLLRWRGRQRSSTPQKAQKPDKSR
ncbi:MAG: hypothetical protein KA295_04455 [Giesbergeria sp.]|nr:hypothetical protein [Giesbergeria sp.]